MLCIDIGGYGTGCAVHTESGQSEDAASCKAIRGRDGITKATVAALYFQTEAQILYHWSPWLGQGGKSLGSDLLYGSRCVTAVGLLCGFHWPTKAPP